MKLQYYPETDSLYIDLSAKPGVDVSEVAEGIVVDVDETGAVVGIDIDRASKLLDLHSVETIGLPVPAGG